MSSTFTFTEEQPAVLWREDQDRPLTHRTLPFMLSGDLFRVAPEFRQRVMIIEGVPVWTRRQD